MLSGAIFRWVAIACGGQLVVLGLGAMFFSEYWGGGVHAVALLWVNFMLGWIVGSARKAQRASDLARERNRVAPVGRELLRRHGLERLH